VFKPERHLHSDLLGMLCVNLDADSCISNLDDPRSIGLIDGKYSIIRTQPGEALVFPSWIGHIFEWTSKSSVILVFSASVDFQHGPSPLHVHVTAGQAHGESEHRTNEL